MATTTQNLGLIKPAGTDKIRIAQINSNMDTIDTKMGPVGSTPLQTQATNAASSISALQKGMAIVCNGNTHAAIASGQFVYVRNHSSLSEGLYTATANIAANGALSNSNLSAVASGGLNALNSKLANEFFDVTYSSDITDIIVRAGRMCFYNEATKTVHLNFFIASRAGLIPVANNTICTVPGKYKPTAARDLGYAIVKPLSESDWSMPSIESIRIETDGSIRLGNYIYGNKPTKMLALTATYVI